MTASQTKPRTATDRSVARNHRAERILGGIALDREHTHMLADILADSGETAAAWVRRMIREQAPLIDAARNKTP